ncbi:hypothetical protein JB92DRAFT_2705368 [Gautieria morchelliformis]|nr:hypothetical protein JB92DRAFT_2705368 [Gautieria morchelliformis]
MEAAILSSLKPIPLPPSISQRKRLPLLSLALCYLNDEERITCILVSKLFRYAVYLSAHDILNRSFSGKRLSRLICSLPSRNLTPKMTNLWPYLRLRQKEVRRSKKAYARGWVAQYFRETGSPATRPMTEKLWTNPDCEEQCSVVQRFIQTRLCFALSFHGMGSASGRWVSSTVVDAQEVLPNEIWSITVATSKPEDKTGDQEMMHYVLYQTCEVIGHPPPDSLADGASLMETGSGCIPLRADWSEYIARRLLPATRHLCLPLLEHVRGTNTDDFEGGAAKGWLKRLRSQGKEGKEKLVVAERYMLGCVVGNSVSGAYQSAARMALEFSGLDNIRDNERKGERQSAPEINLFLPERHNVESVHFTSPRGPLHPAIAVVQTAGRQDGSFVLRENGVLIGEDEQVPEIWMKLLGCTANGMKAS